MTLLNVFGITNAYAAAGGSHGGGLMSLLPMFLILFLLMYFIIIRPQSKRAKQQRQLLSSIKEGDEIMTNGGFLGRVVKVADTFVIVNLAKDVDVHLQKGAIARTLPKGTIKSS